MSLKIQQTWPILMSKPTNKIIPYTNRFPKEILTSSRKTRFPSSNWAKTKRNSCINAARCMSNRFTNCMNKCRIYPKVAPITASSITSAQSSITLTRLRNWETNWRKKIRKCSTWSNSITLKMMKWTPLAYRSLLKLRRVKRIKTCWWRRSIVSRYK